MSNLKKSHMLLKARISYKSNGHFYLMRDLIEWFLQKRDRSSPDVFQPGYIKVSAPKTSLCFQTFNGLSRTWRSAWSSKSRTRHWADHKEGQNSCLGHIRQCGCTFLTLPQGNGILKVVQWDLEQNHGLGNSERFFAAQVHLPLILLTTCCFFKRSSLPHQPHSCSREEATHVSF